MTRQRIPPPDAAAAESCISHHPPAPLARPLDLADQVLRAGGVAGWDKDRIDAVIASTKNTVVNLQAPLPVQFTRLTAWVDGGAANFRRDIHGHDAELLAALDGKSIAL